MSQNKKELSTFGDFLHSIDQFFSDSFRNFHDNGLFQQTSFPVKTYRTDDHFIIEAELAGIAKEQLQIEIYEQYVRIAVDYHEKNEQHNELEQSYQVNERFEINERIVHLPFDVNSKTAKASFKNGLLTIRFPIQRKTLEISEDDR